MKIAVMGSGGVGGYFGSRLALAGHDVHFIARGAHMKAMLAQGLKITSPLGDMQLPKPRVTDDPATIGTADIVLFGVKLWDTESAAHAVKPLIGPNTAVISFQNGVVKDELLVAALGETAVAGGVCYIAATIAEPGVVAHTGSMAKLVFGELDGRISDRMTAFHQACHGAGIDALLSDDITRAVWEKFVFLVGLSATTTATRNPIGAVRANSHTRQLLEQVMQEVVAVGLATGARLAPDYAQDRMRFCDQLPEAMTSSMHRDLERGNRLELPWLSGDVSRRGQALGVPTPANTALFQVLALQAEGAAP